MSLDDLDLTIDKFNSGMRKGYNNALRILREFDMKISEVNDDDDIYNVGLSNLYNIQKDLIHEIYGVIKKEMEEHTDDEFSS